jgi:hypothetical protein
MSRFELGMIIFVIAQIIFSAFTALFLGNIGYDLLKTKKDILQKMEAHQEWLFHSLYSIDSKVKLPEAFEETLENKPAKVYNPTKDPMSEFNGAQDDWHE